MSGETNNKRHKRTFIMTKAAALLIAAAVFVSGTDEIHAMEGLNAFSQDEDVSSEERVAPKEAESGDDSEPGGLGMVVDEDFEPGRTSGLLDGDAEPGGYRSVPGENDIESTTIPSEDGPEHLGTEALPAKYITAELPNLRNQFYSTCWAHASLALAEISLMKKGVSESDLSELHTVWFSYHSVTDPLGGTEGDSNGVPSGTDVMNVGGNPIFTQNVLAGWTGAADEETLRSSDAQAVRNKSLVPSDDQAYLDAAHLTGFYEVNLHEDPEGAKRLIRDKGAIAVSYYSASNSSPELESGTFNSATGAYYDKSPHGGRQNHAVVIVGWDDDFSVDFFNSQNRPKGNGAWLVRNSWTTGLSAGWKDNLSYAGYFWMSYENASLAAAARAFDVEMSDDYAHNYQYDGAMYRKGWNPCSDGRSELGAANVYEAKACDNGEFLEAVAFQTTSSNLEYVISVYTDLTDPANPESGRKITESTATGTTVYPGYHTVTLPVPVPIGAGQKFAVVVTLKKSGESPTICREQDWSGWATIRAEAKAGQSFYYDDGWKDVAALNDSAGNVVIKAFTNDIPENAVFVPEALDFEEGLAGTGLTIGPGEKKALRIRFTPRYVSDPTVTWHSSDEEVAYVDGQGVLHGLSNGQARITATSNAVPEVSGSFVVTVERRAKWIVDPVKETDAATRAALAEDLSIVGEAEDGSLTDAQLYDVLSRFSVVDEDGNRSGVLWIGGIDEGERAYVYTGAAIRPAVHVYDGIRLLKKKKDYVLAYANDKNAGQASITVKFKGNYGSGKKVVNYTIAPAELGVDVTADEIALLPKKLNAQQKPLPKLRNVETGAVMAYRTSDFDVTYGLEEVDAAGDADDVGLSGSAAAVSGVTAPGSYVIRMSARTKPGQNYQGEISVPVLVTGKRTPISKVSVSLEKKSYVYTGSEIVPGLILTDASRNDTLREGTDYVLEIRNNVEPGRAVCLITGMGRYAGTRSVDFRIKNGKRADSDSIRVAYDQSVPYLKAGAVPTVTVTDGDRKLTEGVDYVVACGGNGKVTQNAVLKVKFKGRYAGTVNRNYAIEKRNLDELRDGVTAADVVLTSKADSYKKTFITICDVNGKKLSVSDYEITEYVNADDDSEVTSPGMGDLIRVTIRGKGNYEGETSATYALISPAMKLTRAKQLKKLPSVRYAGESVILPDGAFEGLFVTSAGEALRLGRDFEVVGYSGNDGRGTGRVTLRGIPRGDGTGFGGTRTLTFTIRARNTERLEIFGRMDSGS